MTPEQFAHWTDFAQRMARTLYADHREPDAAWILEAVESFMGGIEPDDIPCIVDWDNSEHYQAGTRNYHRTHRCLCWNCNRHDAKVPCPYRCEGGNIYDYAKPHCTGDMVSLFLDDEVPRASLAEPVYPPELEEPRYISYELWNAWKIEHRAEIEARDQECDRIDRAWEDSEDSRQEAIDQQWGGPVRCCIRAGLDLAAAPSGGVCGFTAGDLRRMYPEGVPEWIKQYFAVGELVSLSGGPDFFALGDVKPDPRTFGELPDDQSVWL